MFEGIEGVRQYTIVPRKVGRYQIMRPVEVIGFWTGKSEFRMQYEFGAIEQSMGVVGRGYVDAEQRLCEALVALYSDLTRIDDSQASENQKLMNAIGRADLGAFIMPICLPVPQLP